MLVKMTSRNKMSTKSQEVCCFYLKHKTKNWNEASTEDLNKTRPRVPSKYTFNIGNLQLFRSKKKLKTQKLGSNMLYLK